MFERLLRWLCWAKKKRLGFLKGWLGLGVLSVAAGLVDVLSKLSHLSHAYKTSKSNSSWFSDDA